VQKAAKNNERPQLNAVGQVNFQGVSESWKESVNDIFDDEILGWALGFQFEVPIGNRQARAIYQRTMLQLQQAIDQYRLVMQDVANEVAQAHNAVTYSWEQLVARRREVFAQRDALRAIELRQETGEPLTFSFVQLKLDQQGRLAQSASDEAQALAAYNTAIARLEQAKGTLLRYNNVVMKEEKGPAFTKIVEEPKKK
jgi:outer membrane protein TolC